MRKEEISADLQYKILREIKDLTIEKPWYLGSLLAEADDLIYPDIFITECKKAISKNSAFLDNDVLNHISGSELTVLFDLNSVFKY